MGKKILIFIIGLVFVTGAYSQSRLALPNDPNAVARSGQAEIIINAANADRNVAVWINGMVVAHLQPKTSEKIIVRNGQNLVEVADTTADRGQWKIGTKRSLTVNSNSDCIVIGLTTRYGALLNLTLQNTLALGGGPLVSPAPVPAPATAAARPVPAPARPAATPPASGGVDTVEGAVYRAALLLAESLPDSSTVAVLSIASDDAELAEFVIEELVYKIVATKKFRVVDRRSLDVIQKETKFQYSGDVDDNSAVSIGKLLGANVVITGSVGGTGPTRRIRAKALNVQTAEILAMASERY